LIEEKPSKVVLDIISDLGGIMGLCIGASLMSFIELIDLALDCIFIYCGFKGQRVDVEEKSEKSESEIRLLKVEGELKLCINKNAWLEAELSATRELILKLLDKSKDQNQNFN